MLKTMGSLARLIVGGVSVGVRSFLLLASFIISGYISVNIEVNLRFVVGSEGKFDRVL